MSWSNGTDRRANMVNLRQEPAEKRRFRWCESESTSNRFANRICPGGISRYFGLVIRRMPRCASVIDHMTTSVQGALCVVRPTLIDPQYQCRYSRGISGGWYTSIAY